MERSNHLHNADQSPQLINGQDLERQLALAEQRYAAARAASDHARSEFRALTLIVDVSPQLLRSARARLEAITARCKRLRVLIDNLEEKLDL